MQVDQCLENDPTCQGGPIELEGETFGDESEVVDRGVKIAKGESNFQL